ncbi:aminotransferase A [Metabacillus iocasae]|uniref:Aminotransferase n=1 Tax=Priestia iocasae TaxID=2291674 RepID=A0ABS2QZ36_9BACI|nr:aminotransferase A [Metabacillus iocasae]MBM7704687.1 aminotransferase [Metabacillus iocasae]
MEHLINDRVKNIQISGIRTFFNMVSQYEDVLSLTIGQPDFLTPDSVKTAAKQAIDQNKTSYTHNAGILELRQAASQFVRTNYNQQYDPETEVIVTIGASQAIDIAMRTILEEGSEVILPGPVYPGYEPLIRLAGAIPVHVDTTNTGFRLTADLINQHITEKTRCIILPYPSNPTGVTLSKTELEDIATLLHDKDIFVLSDEIYSELVFDGKHESIATIPSMRDKTIVVNGVSKSHSMTGWRIGLLFAPAYISKHMLKVHQYNVSCASSISQIAALEALTTAKDESILMKQEYEKRRNYVYERLVAMGFEVEKPSGAFYLFPSIQKFHKSSFDFALSLVKDAGVALVPGNAFSTLGEGYVRLSYAYSMDTLTEALNRLEHHLNKN